MLEWNLEVIIPIKSPSVETDFADVNSLIQLVNFNTWSRTVNGVRKESLLDHIYVDDDAIVKDDKHLKPLKKKQRGNICVFCLFFKVA